MTETKDTKELAENNTPGIMQKQAYLNEEVKGRIKVMLSSVESLDEKEDKKEEEKEKKEETQFQNDNIRSRNLGTMALTEKRTVMTAFEVINIGIIDTMNEKYQAEVNIESRWEVFPNQKDNEDVINNYNPEKHWNPKLYIENAVAVKEEISYDTTIENNRYFITEKRNAKGYFWAHLKLKNFPVDVQELEIVLTSSIGSEKLALIRDESKVSFIIFDATLTFRDQQKWKLFRLVTTKTEATYEATKSQNKILKSTRKHTENNIKKIVKARKEFKPPKLVATCYAARRPGFYLMNAFFLVFLITTMTLANFSINFKLPHFRLQTTYVILLTSISFKWVVNRSLPPISYLTSLDAYQISSICFICFLAMWHAIVGDARLVEAGEAETADKWMLLTFGLIFLVMQCCYIVWGYIAYSKVREVKRAEEEYFEDHKNQFLPQELLSPRKFSIFPGQSLM